MKRMIVLTLSLLLLACVFAPAAFANGTGTAVSIVDDGAEVLSASELQSLSDKASSIAEQLDIDVVFVITSDLGSYNTKMEYADDYFDYNGYGPDGVLVLLTMLDENGKRGLYTSTAGSCISKFNEDEQDAVFDDVYDELSSGSYYAALMDYADGIAYHVSPHVPLSSLLIALVVGFIIALVVTGVLKKKLTTVEMQHGAKSYVRAGSMEVTASRDTFLYSTMTRTEKPRDNDRTHTGSSGTSHGGSGHSF